MVTGHFSSIYSQTSDVLVCSYETLGMDDFSFRKHFLLVQSLSWSSSQHILFWWSPLVRCSQCFCHFAVNDCFAGWPWNLYLNPKISCWSRHSTKFIIVQKSTKLVGIGLILFTVISPLLISVNPFVVQCILLILEWWQLCKFKSNVRTVKCDFTSVHI